MLFVACGFKSRDSNVHVQFRSFFSNLLLHFLQASAFPSATLRPWPWWEHTSVRGKLWPSAFLCLVMTSVHPWTSLLSSSSIFFHSGSAVHTFKSSLTPSPGSGIGTFILAPVVQLLIQHYTWRGALLILGGLVSNLCVCGALMKPLGGADEQWVLVTLVSSLWNFDYLYIFFFIF